MAVRSGITRAFRPWETWPRVGSQWPAYNVESEQAEGLVAWWSPLASEFGGRILRDMTGRGNNTSTWVNLAWRSDTYLGQVLLLDGSSTYTQVPRDDDVEPANFTLTAWIRTSISSDVGYIFLKPYTSFAAPYYTYGLYVTPTQIGGFAVVGSWGSDELNINPTGGVTNKDLLVAATYDGTDFKLYCAQAGEFLDGTLNNAGSLTYYNTPLTIGRRAYLNDRYFPGRLGDLRILSHACTFNQIYDLWHPRTRWELHQVPRHNWAVLWEAPAAGNIKQLATINWANVKAFGSVAEASLKQVATIDAN